MKFYCAECQKRCVVESEEKPYICKVNPVNYCNFTVNPMKYIPMNHYDRVGTIKNKSK